MSDQSGEGLKIIASAFCGLSAFIGTILLGTEGGGFLVREELVSINYTLPMSILIVIVSFAAAGGAYKGMRRALA
ncbi:MAG: hypothetical protein AAB955_03440 [Patescibacteria group bacterium]